MPNPQPEPTVTSEDLQEKWQDVEDAVREQVERKVLGVSYLTLGVLAASVGALGAAYYLGRRTAHSTPCRGPEDAARQAPEPIRPRPAAPPNPLLDQLVRSAITAMSDRLKPPPQ